MGVQIKNFGADICTPYILMGRTDICNRYLHRKFACINAPKGANLQIYVLPIKMYGGADSVTDIHISAAKNCLCKCTLRCLV